MACVEHHAWVVVLKKKKLPSIISLMCNASRKFLPKEYKQKCYSCSKNTTTPKTKTLNVFTRNFSWQFAYKNLQIVANRNKITLVTTVSR